jgi:hypothetical protein
MVDREYRVSDSEIKMRNKEFLCIFWIWKVLQSVYSMAWVRVKRKRLRKMIGRFVLMCVKEAFKLVKASPFLFPASNFHRVNNKFPQNNKWWQPFTHKCLYIIFQKRRFNGRKARRSFPKAKFHRFFSRVSLFTSSSQTVSHSLLSKHKTDSHIYNTPQSGRSSTAAAAAVQSV